MFIDNLYGLQAFYWIHYIVLIETVCTSTRPEQSPVYRCVSDRGYVVESNKLETMSIRQELSLKYILQPSLVWNSLTTNSQFVVS